MIPLDGDVEGGKAALQRLKKFGLNVDQFTTNKGDKCKFFREYPYSYFRN